MNGEQTNEHNQIADDDRLKEIREGLAQVRLEARPPWGIKALFTAVFRIVDILETSRVNQAQTAERLRLLEEKLDGKNTISLTSSE